MLTQRLFEAMVLRERKLADAPTHAVAEELQRVVRMVVAVLRDLVRTPANGKIMTVDVGLTPKTIDPKLDRKITGYIVVGKTAAVDVYHTSMDKTLTLTGTASATVTLLVF